MEYMGWDLTLLAETGGEKHCLLAKGVSSNGLMGIQVYLVVGVQFVDHCPAVFYSWRELG